VYAETISAILKIATVGLQQAGGRGTIKTGAAKKSLGDESPPWIVFSYLTIFTTGSPKSKKARQIRPKTLWNSLNKVSGTPITLVCRSNRPQVQSDCTFFRALK
jgi:hypothetical protein